MNDADMQKDVLIDLQSKAMVRQKLNNQNLDEFWCSQMDSYQVLANKALAALLPFATTYFFESAFSTLVNLKPKTRYRLEASLRLLHEFRILLQTEL